MDTRYMLSEGVELLTLTINHGKLNTVCPLAFLQRVGE